MGGPDDGRAFGRAVDPVSKTMAFEHPLARRARVWTATSRDGTQQRILVVSTTVTLDPTDQRYRKPLVDRLSSAAGAYLTDSNEAAWFVLINGERKGLKNYEPRAAATPPQTGRKPEAGQAAAHETLRRRP